MKFCYMVFNQGAIYIRLSLNKKMKNKKHYTVGTVTNSNRKIVETEIKSIPLAHIYLTAYFPDLVQTV